MFASETATPAAKRRPESARTNTNQIDRIGADGGRRTFHLHAPHLRDMRRARHADREAPAAPATGSRTARRSRVQSIRSIHASVACTRSATDSSRIAPECIGWSTNAWALSAHNSFYKHPPLRQNGASIRARDALIQGLHRRFVTRHSQGATRMRADVSPRRSSSGRSPSSSRPSARPRAEHDCRCREGHVGRRAAGRHRRSGESGPHREDAQRRHRRRRPLCHRRPPPRHLHA